MLGAKRKVFGNIVGHVKGAEGLIALSACLQGEVARAIQDDGMPTSIACRRPGCAFSPLMARGVVPTW